MKTIVFDFIKGEVREENFPEVREENFPATLGSATTASARNNATWTIHPPPAAK